MVIQDKIDSMVFQTGVSLKKGEGQYGNPT